MPIITKQIEVSPDLTVTIRKLSYWHVKQAKAARQAEVAANAKQTAQTVDMREIASQLTPETISAIRALRDEQEKASPEESYDMPTVLHNGIVGWSWDDEPKAQIIDDLLGEEEADFIFREIIAFSVRTPDEKKESAGTSPPTSEPVTAAGQ